MALRAERNAAVIEVATARQHAVAAEAAREDAERAAVAALADVDAAKVRAAVAEAERIYAEHAAADAQATIDTVYARAAAAEARAALADAGMAALRLELSSAAQKTAPLGPATAADGDSSLRSSANELIREAALASRYGKWL